MKKLLLDNVIPCFYDFYTVFFFFFFFFLGGVSHSSMHRLNINSIIISVAAPVEWAPPPPHPSTPFPHGGGFSSPFVSVCSGFPTLSVFEESKMGLEKEIYYWSSLPRLLSPSIMPNIVVLISLWSGILQMWPKKFNFLCMTVCTMCFLCYPPCSLSAILHYSIFCGTIWCLITVCSISYRRRWVLWHLFSEGPGFACIQ